MTLAEIRRPIRIGAISGATGDRVGGFQEMASRGNVDILVGDYLAEVNLASNAITMSTNPNAGYEAIFLHQLAGAAEHLVRNKLKVIVNAGALNPEALSRASAIMLQNKGIELKIAYVVGDDIIGRVTELQEQGEVFGHLEDPTGRPLSDWGLKPISANAYIGAVGIVNALEQNADLIICGRVTDASPVIAAAIWWHGWSFDQYDQLAGALLAGHCVECGAYVTGGNFSGFKAVPEIDLVGPMPFPIAEIAHDGTFVITKHPDTGGIVSIDTVRCQILYEIQGNIYRNPDVQADIKDISVQADDDNRVVVTGIKGYPPPETTKVAVCAIGGYQAEAAFFATGLDVTEKFRNIRQQAENSLGPERLAEFSTFDWTQYGTPQEDPETEAAATAYLRVFVQAPNKHAFGPAQHLLALVASQGLGTYLGCHSNMDMRQAIPKPYIEYWPCIMAVKNLVIQTHFLDGSASQVSKMAATHTIPVMEQIDESSTSLLLDDAEVDDTVKGPLGWIVHARSGDKGGNANVGFFVRHEDEYPWLAKLLSTERLKKLLAKEYQGHRIERVEFPGMLAVHFVIHDLLGHGVSSTSRMDSLAKSVGEFLRAKHVDLPKKFLNRGRI